MPGNINPEVLAALMERAQYGAAAGSADRLNYFLATMRREISAEDYAITEAAAAEALASMAPKA